MNRTRSNLLPYGLLAPGLLWLLVFFAVPLYYMAEISLKTGNDEIGYRLTWHFQTYTDALSNYQDQFIRSFEYAGLSTLIALVIAFPLAYVIAFRGGRYKNALLLLVILPFFITYLVRTLSWQTILDDSGWIVSFLKTIGVLGDDGRLLATSTAVVAGITYNYLPFMILPVYAVARARGPAHAGGGLRPLRQAPRRDHAPGGARGGAGDRGGRAAHLHPGGRRLRERRAARHAAAVDDRQRDPEPLPRDRRLPDGRGALVHPDARSSW